jgi:hypothetical protein
MYRLALLITAAVVSSFDASQVQDEREPPLELILNAAAEYVRGYQDQLTSVIADEVYTQQISALVPNDPALPRFRRLNSEVFFVRVNAGEDWMAIRDVVRVDGQVVENRRVLLDEIRRLPVSEVAEAFKAQNSRFNLGRTYRNFNEPVLALRALTDLHRSRFSFERQRVQRTAGITLMTVSFAEQSGPTLIRDLTFGVVLTRGDLTIEVGTGRIRRSRLTAASGPVRFELSTDFTHDARLDILVPNRFRERYEHGIRPTSLEGVFEYEEIVCEATYSNYRRFETGGRIKKRS